METDTDNRNQYVTLSYRTRTRVISTRDGFWFSHRAVGSINGYSPSSPSTDRTTTVVVWFADTLKSGPQRSSMQVYRIKQTCLVAIRTRMLSSKRLILGVGRWNKLYYSLIGMWNRLWDKFWLFSTYDRVFYFTYLIFIFLHQWFYRAVSWSLTRVLLKLPNALRTLIGQKITGYLVLTYLLLKIKPFFPKGDSGR